MLARSAGALCLLLAACTSGALALGRLDELGPDADAGIAAEAGPGDAGDICLPGEPVRHYPFDGVGTEIVDRRGGPSGLAHGGATLDGSGVLALDGVDDWVALPSGLLDGLEEVTIAVWVRRRGGGGYTRIFDIGTTSLGAAPDAGAAYVGRAYLAATPSTGNVPSGVAALVSPAGSASEVRAASADVLDDALHQVVVVVGAGTLALYWDGAPAATAPLAFPLSAIASDDAWLGRSNYAADPYLWGEYADVRVYGRALASCAVAATFAAGP